MGGRISVCVYFHTHDGHVAPATKCSHSRVLHMLLLSYCSPSSFSASSGCVLMSWHVASCWSHAWLALVLSNQRASACVCMCKSGRGWIVVYVYLALFSCQLFIPTYEYQWWLWRCSSWCSQRDAKFVLKWPKSENKWMKICRLRLDRNAAKANGLSPKLKVSLVIRKVMPYHYSLSWDKWMCYPIT